MKNYHYIAYENRGYFKDEAHPERDKPTDMQDFESPEKLVEYLAKKVVVLGDGRGRLQDMVLWIQTVQIKHDEATARRVAGKLTS